MKEKSDSRNSDYLDKTCTVVLDLDTVLEEQWKPWFSWSNLADILYAQVKESTSSGDQKIDGSEFLSAFPILKKAYEKFRLFWAAATLQYYHVITHGQNPRVEAAGEAFEKAADWLREKGVLYKEQDGERHLRYALFYCEQKANLGRRFCGRSPLVLADVLAKKCRDLFAEYPDFYNASVLAGLALEIAEDYATDAINDFVNSTKGLKLAPYLSSVYYWIGKRCENDDARAEIMGMAYDLGYQLDRKYRLCYKKAMLEERKRNWKAALLYYNECVNYLLKKRFYLDPLEQEYYFKALLRISFICLTKTQNKNPDADKILPLLKFAEKFRDEIAAGMTVKNRSTCFYFDLYGEEAPAYIGDLLNRLNPRQMYQYLGETCRLLGQKDESEKYFKKYDEWKSDGTRAALSGLG